MTKVMVNGAWIGVINDPEELVTGFREQRRRGEVNIFTSIRWDAKRCEVHIYSDAGRPMHPLFYMRNGEMSVYSDAAKRILSKKKFSWIECAGGS